MTGKEPPTYAGGGATPVPQTPGGDMQLDRTAAGAMTSVQKPTTRSGDHCEDKYQRVSHTADYHQNAGDHAANAAGLS